MVKSPNFDPLKSLKPPENAGFKLPFWMVKYHRFGWLSHHVISSEITGKITSHQSPYPASAPHWPGRPCRTHTPPEPPLGSCSLGAGPNRFDTIEKHGRW